MDTRNRLSGGVASEQTRASEIGTALLAVGGNAADAMVGTVLAINCLSMYHSDLGGGGFCLIRKGSGDFESLNFRQSAPKALTMEYLRTRSTSDGGATVGVPGQMRGLEELHKRYGRLPWERCFEEVIKMAEDGFEMRGDLHHYAFRDLPDDTRAGSFMDGQSEYDMFFRENGSQKAPEDKVYRKGWAEALRRIAKGSADAFYEGEIAEALVTAVNAKEGVMTVEDLREYRPQWNKPLHKTYRDRYRLWTTPAPASGAVWLAAMGMLERFQPEGSATTADLHRLTEVLRHAYAQRSDLGDPDYVANMDKTQARITSQDEIARRAATIDDSKTYPPEHYMPTGVKVNTDAGTSHIVTADSSGLVISLTTTVGLPFGSKIIVPGWGFVLNDSVDDFSIVGKTNGTGYEPSPANYVEGGKRPLSSSCPYIVEDMEGRVIAAGGAAGGSTIISANVQVARNMLDYNMTAAEALRADRLHNQLAPNVTQLERSSTHQGIILGGFSDAQAKALEEKGHKVEWLATSKSVPCAMRFLAAGKLEPAGDPRKHDSGGSTYQP